MLKKLLASGMIAGVVAGLIATLLQLVFVVPLIMQAELYESGQITHFAQAAADHHAAPAVSGDHDHASHSHDSAPEGGVDLSRHGLTLVANIATYAGFGLILAALFGLAESRGIRLNARSGALWGGAGFVAMHLATGAGLPPELPGNFAADLQARQIWWLATAALTFGGIMALAYGRNAATWALGAVLIALPHIIGAPHPHEFGGVVPPELIALFVTRVLAVAAIVWLVLGGLAGLVWARHETH